MMLATWTRVVARSSGYAFKSRGPLARTVDIALANQFPARSRLLATAAAAKQPVKKVATKTTTKTPATREKTTAKKTTGTAKTSAAKRTSAGGRKAPVKVTEAKKPGRPRKKELTPEEKLKLQVRELRARALDPPAIHPAASAWVTFCKEKYDLLKARGQGSPGQLKNHSSVWVNEYKNLPEAERKALDQRTDDRRKSLIDELHRWVASHTPAQIHDANLARASLRRIKKEHPDLHGLSRAFPSIPDSRFPKRGRSPQIFYAMEASKDAPNKQTALRDAMKAWTTLTEPQKEKYKEMSVQDHARFEHDLAAIGMQPTPKR